MKRKASAQIKECELKAYGLSVTLYQIEKLPDDAAIQ
jgi:hypothetical protein